MTANELRELSERLEAKWFRWKDRPTDELKAAAYLRACADALEAGPVAMGWRSQDGEVADCISIEEADRNGAGAYTVPLYPLAMPAQTQTLRLPEPMTDAEVFAAMDRYEVEGYDIARWAEAETLRRVKECNK